MDDFPLGIAAEGDMDRLPDGVTFVPRITFCEVPQEPGKTARGCARTGGTQIAARMDLVSSMLSMETFSFGAVLLHELLHSQGAEHVLGDSENLMTDEGVIDIPHLDQGQCEMLIKRKSYPMGFSGLEPWE